MPIASRSKPPIELSVPVMRIYRALERLPRSYERAKLLSAKPSSPAMRIGDPSLDLTLTQVEPS